MHVFVDAPRKESQRLLVESTEKVAREAEGFAAIEVIRAQQNQGLAGSILKGVRQLLQTYDALIVLEDDMLTSPWFLTYMKEGLELYYDRPEVASLHGYIYPHGKTLPRSFFIRGADCWGWATWKDRFELFEEDGRQLLLELRNQGLLDEFDFHGTSPYLHMLCNQILGRNDSWAIRWHASCFLQNRLTLYQDVSLVQNFGEDGTHCSDLREYQGQLEQEYRPLKPIEVQVSPEGHQAMADFFAQVQPSFLSRIKQRLFRLFLFGLW